MTSFPQALRPRSVVVIGGGVVGCAAAWLLVHRGHGVTLVDPAIDRPPQLDGRLSGSEAALGLLMADVFHRGRGRAWTLRQRARQLWGEWQTVLAARGLPIDHRPGLLLLAADQLQWQRQQALAAERQALGIPLEAWSAGRITTLEPRLPPGCPGGLHSPRDGQLDPPQVLRQWLSDGRSLGLGARSAVARQLEPLDQGWRLQLDSGPDLEADWILLAAGLELVTLWPQAALAAPPTLEPVLGQALELQVPEDVPDPGQWPGSLAWQGINLVPRPGRRLWLGATLESGMTAEPTALERLRTLEGQAPDWLRRSRVLRHWEGLRVKPVGQPAPLCSQPAAGLLVVGGTYRNGVLLAPALAEWVVECVESS